jgi:hypothetical protein
MNTEKNNDNLDEQITGAIRRNNLEFDFDKWKQSHKREIEVFNSQGISTKVTSDIYEPNIRKMSSWRQVVYAAVTLLVICSLAACFILYEKVTSLKGELEIARSNVTDFQADETVTINFYLKEHEELIARQASFNSATETTPIHVNQNDIMYYDLIAGQSEYMSPGIIVRVPSYPGQADTNQPPAISNGHTLTLSEARDGADFDLVSPPWLLPCYRLDQIRKIEACDALQLLYTDGIDSVSLFEQPLDGRRLSHDDFREYAVYNNTEQKGVTILAWRDDALSYVLIGNTELSQLMDMAQSINAAK